MPSCCIVTPMYTRTPIDFSRAPAEQFLQNIFLLDLPVQSRLAESLPFRRKVGKGSRDGPEEVFLVLYLIAVTYLLSRCTPRCIPNPSPGRCGSARCVLACTEELRLSSWSGARIKTCFPGTYLRKQDSVRVAWPQKSVLTINQAARGSVARATLLTPRRRHTKVLPGTPG